MGEWGMWWFQALQNREDIETVGVLLVE